MAKLTAYYSRAGENYFGGEYRHINIGNTERAAKMIAKITGADLFKIEQKNSYSSTYSVCIKQAQKFCASAKPALWASRRLSGSHKMICGTMQDLSLCHCLKVLINMMKYI